MGCGERCEDLEDRREVAGEESDRNGGTGQRQRGH